MIPVLKFIGIDVRGDRWIWKPAGPDDTPPCLGDATCKQRPLYIVETESSYIPVCTACLVKLQALRSLTASNLGYREYSIWTIAKSQEILGLTTQPKPG